jgi:hypothetical protein
LRGININRRILIKLRYRIVGWTKLAWDKVQWQAAMIIIIDLEVPHKEVSS